MNLSSVLFYLVTHLYIALFILMTSYGLGQVIKVWYGRQMPFTAATVVIIVAFLGASFFGGYIFRVAHVWARKARKV